MRSDPTRRRALALLTGTAAAGLAGCGTSPVRLAVPWSGWELARFREVMRGLPGRLGHPVVFSAGDSMDALLKNPVARSARPDVAFIPRLGTLGESASGLLTMRSAIPGPSSAADAAWKNLLVHGGHVKGVWFKAAHKSLIWHRTATPPPCGAHPAEPASFAQWLVYCRTAPRPVLSIGAADGWVLTDWFENVLLGIDPDAYRSLLPVVNGRERDTGPGWDGPAVTRALEYLGQLWGTPGLLPGGGRRALLTSFHDSILDVFHYGHAQVVAAPDFAYPVISRYGNGKPIPMPCRFPAVNPGTAPVLVAGDAAVALTGHGRDVVDWLADEGRAAVRDGWIRQGGFISLDSRVTGYPGILRPYAGQVIGGNVEFDLSDQLTGRLSGGNGRGLWRILTRFFSDVTGVTSDADPVTSAQKAMTEAAG
jgi:alpha-glucoside transport system substrate-binding protein